MVVAVGRSYRGDLSLTMVRSSMSCLGERAGEHTQRQGPDQEPDRRYGSRVRVFCSHGHQSPLLPLYSRTVAPRLPCAYETVNKFGHMFRCPDGPVGVPGRRTAGAAGSIAVQIEKTAQ